VAFDGLPRDALTEAEFVNHREQIVRATEPYLGVWYDRGDPARRGTARRGVVPADGKPCLEFLGPNGERSWAPYWRMKLDADGHVCDLPVLNLGLAKLSLDGRRMDFTYPEVWWTREPVRSP